MGGYDRNIERKVGVSLTIEDIKGVNDSNTINNDDHDTEHNKTNNNNNLRCNPHDNNDGGSVRDVNKYDRLYYHCGDASSIEHNNVMNENNIHYSPSSCKNDGSSLKYSDDNIIPTNTKQNNMINNNSDDVYPLHENDDGCLGYLYDDQVYLVACREFDCREFIICFTMMYIITTVYDLVSVYDAAYDTVCVTVYDTDTVYDAVCNTIT